MRTLKEILQLPLLSRCREVAIFFDLASMKDLQEGFPMLINSIFYSEGGVGWRFRQISAELTPLEFDCVIGFFHPGGPFFRMLYRLTGESLKYGVPFSDLPKKLRDTLRSGQYPTFYKEKLYIDPIQNVIVGLLMSPFDYFLFYFALNGSYPAIFPTENNGMTSVYITLCCLYASTFLPTNTQYELPQNIEMLAQTMPDIKAVKSSLKTIKYLLPHRLNLDMSTEQYEGLQPECARILHWRSSSFVHIVLDVWFGMELRRPTKLPPVESIRCMRVLVKELHAFSNCPDMCDSPAFVELRKTAREKLCAFFKDSFHNIFYRWPLHDGTLIDVVELWLSYIQPWRYEDKDLLETRTPRISMLVPKFQPFVALNLEIYTQMFLALIWRVVELDLTVLFNANLLYRGCRVFAQRNLMDFLRECEAQQLESKRAADRSVGSFEQQQSYQPLFSDEATSQLKKLLHKLRATSAILKKNIQMTNVSGLPRLMELIRKPPLQKENREMRDVLARLTFAEEMIEVMFDLPAADDGPTPLQLLTKDLETIDASSLPLLSADTWTDVTRLPANSGEIDFLVRFLLTVSDKLQLMYGAEIQALWNCRRFPRMLVRQLLLPPRAIHRFVRQRDGSKQLTLEQLPARICLRPLASYKAIALISCSLLLGGVLFGAPSYGIIMMIAIALIGMFLNAFVTARLGLSQY